MDAVAQVGRLRRIVHAAIGFDNPTNAFVMSSAIVGVDGEAMHRQAVERTCSRRQFVAPGAFMSGTRREDLRLMAAARQRLGNRPQRRFRSADDAAAEAKGDDGDASWPSRVANRRALADGGQYALHL